MLPLDQYIGSFIKYDVIRLITPFLREAFIRCDLSPLLAYRGLKVSEHKVSKSTLKMSVTVFFNFVFLSFSLKRPYSDPRIQNLSPMHQEH